MTTTEVGQSKIIVGTAQFGLDYGVANKSGALSQEESHGIMELASESGVFRLDTAQAYGDSEKVIGLFNEATFEVLTKIGTFPELLEDWADWLSNQVKSSKANIAHHKLTTILFHDTTQFLNGSRDKALQALEAMCSENPELVFGASIYDPIEWEQLKHVQELKIFQVPHNVFDRRFEESGAIQEMSKMGKVVHVRSVFLQGLLLMDPKNLPTYFSPWAPLLEEWHFHCLEKGKTKIGEAANFALSNNLVSGVIIGFDSREHLQGLVSELWSTSKEHLDYPKFGQLPPDLIDPRRWRLN
jgi:aryl-alcohol dehydrogenase-like predicted oxidoreductase